MEFNTLLIGGRGTIGSGLRRYLPEMDGRYRFCSIDLPGAQDRSAGLAKQTVFVDMDIVHQPQAFKTMLPGYDLVVYLARQGNYDFMRRMTDLVFKSILALDQMPMIVASSSVHAVDDAYRFFDNGAYALIADRRFEEITEWPSLISAQLPACPINDYGHEKAYVESWVKHASEAGCGALATRWGGINPDNTSISEERGYFAVWCHQQDAAALVHAAYEAYREGRLPPGRHYFVISANTYNIFDIQTPRNEIGYRPQHNGESFYR